MYLLISWIGILLCVWGGEKFEDILINYLLNVIFTF